MATADTTGIDPARVRPLAQAEKARFVDASPMAPTTSTAMSRCSRSS
jgi:hypothetical protein